MSKVLNWSCGITMVSILCVHYGFLPGVFLNLGFTVLLSAALTLPMCVAWIVAPRIISVLMLFIYLVFTGYMWSITPISLGRYGTYSFADFLLGSWLYITIMYQIVGKEMIEELKYSKEGWREIKEALRTYI
nr:MAG TPA: hypothetical protein [Caudoviricetes sp.]